MKVMRNIELTSPINTATRRNQISYLTTPLLEMTYSMIQKSNIESMTVKQNICCSYDKIWNIQKL